MREVHFHSIDLNLLRIFDALAEERSVTRAGERLGLTQSAVSHALNRLRYALEDELFLRGPDGMTPTPRAMEIWPELRRGLSQLQHALAPTEFDPAAADRTFHIAASTYVGELLLPRVVARIRQEAPQVQLNVQGVDNALGEALETGRIDLAIGAFGRMSDLFARERLFDERLVWVVRKGHPATAQEASAKVMEKLPMVLLSPRSGERAGGERSNRQIEPLVLWDELASDQTPLGRGARQRIKVVVDNAHAALAIVAGSDLAALAPKRLAQSRSKDLGLILVEMGGERPPTALETIWRADRTSHPALSWLRNVLRDVSRDD
jgi:DNA-binding transcriptional LysR family regulator